MVFCYNALLVQSLCVSEHIYVYRRNPYANILTAVGEDLNRPGLKDTPMRAAKAFSYLTSGYNQTLEEVTNNAVFPSDNREMVLVKNIEFYSLCEHHLLPFYGRVHIAYLPEGNVLGLSKFARITEMFARRLQIQEKSHAANC